MTYRIEIPARLYAACAGAASTEESRPILNGINLVGGPGGEVTAAATDGHALVMGRSFSEQPTVLPADGIILPPVKLSALGITKGALDTSTVIGTSEDGKTWTMTGALRKYGYPAPTGKLARVEAIEGPFPNVRQVIPRPDQNESVTCISVDPDVFCRATSLLGKVSLRFHGDNGPMLAVPHALHGFSMFGLFMPLLPPTIEETGAPEWVHGTVAPTVEA